NSLGFLSRRLGFGSRFHRDNASRRGVGRGAGLRRLLKVHPFHPRDGAGGRRPQGLQFFVFILRGLSLGEVCHPLVLHRGAHLELYRILTFFVGGIGGGLQSLNVVVSVLRSDGIADLARFHREGFFDQVVPT